MAAVPTFLDLLAEAVGEQAEEVVGLDGAVENLYQSVLQAQYGGKMSEAEAEAVFERAALEVLRVTRGMPFRLDMSWGPLFVWLPLWRFAGRGGPYMGEDGAPGDPTWDGDWRADTSGGVA